MSNIAWTSGTWNPLVGCTKVSAGCKGCYAIRQAWRNAHMPHTAERYAGTVEKTSSGLNWTGQVNLVESVLDKPLRWRKPRRVFVNSMSDLFHESVPDEWIDAVFGVMASAPQHTFQVLTKRPERMREWFAGLAARRDSNGHAATWFPFGVACRRFGIGTNETLRRAVASHPEHSNRSRDLYWPLPNVWLGVSVEDQATADARIPLLLETPAAVRWISAEPLLGQVDVSRRLVLPGNPDTCSLGGCGKCRRIDWVVVGGESGPGARPCDVAWIRSIVRQCCVAGVPAFVKQLGAQPKKTHPSGLGVRDYELALNDRKGGDPAEWPEDLRVREFPDAARSAREGE